jgi:hypothetical protein
MPEDLGILPPTANVHLITSVCPTGQDVKPQEPEQNPEL